VKRTATALILSLLLLSVAAAEEVRVRLFSAHPPTSIEILAAGGLLRWKRCISCAEQSSSRLLIASTKTGGELRTDAQSQFFVTGRYELRTPGAPSVFFRFPLDVRIDSGVLNIVVAMPPESYVEHVLMAESADFKNEEAMKAMAVTVRTYSNRFRGQHSKEGFDFCDTTHCQVFRWKEPSDQIHAAVDATAAKLLTYRGAAAATYYHQDCGGTAASASEAWGQISEAYLLVHADPFCVVSGGLKWETSLTREQIDRALRASGIDPPESWRQILIRARTKSGRVQTILFDGGNGKTFAVSGSSFRFAVNRALGWDKIRSDLYDVRNLGDNFLFSGHGAGHGVGLCQAGAKEMARQGKGYREILAFYFPGAELTEASVSRPAGESWQKLSDERFDLLSARPHGDARIFPLAERILRESEDSIGWKLPYRPRLQVFPTLDSYRDATGQPGWVAASTRGRTIRLQPLAHLRQRAVFESTLRHELTHLLVEARAKTGTSIWFREGLVLYFSGNAGAESALSLLPPDRIDAILAKGDTQENTRRAYQSADKIIRAFIQKYGKEKVLSWLSSGLPVDAIAEADAFTAESPSR
jgi:stage II sporulation protein D